MEDDVKRIDPPMDGNFLSLQQLRAREMTLKWREKMCRDPVLPDIRTLAEKQRFARLRVKINRAKPLVAVCRLGLQLRRLQAQKNLQQRLKEERGNDSYVI